MLIAIPRAMALREDPPKISLTISKRVLCVLRPGLIFSGGSVYAEGMWLQLLGHMYDPAMVTARSKSMFLLMGGIELNI